MSAITLQSVEAATNGAKQKAPARRAQNTTANKPEVTTIPVADLTRDPAVNSRAAGISEKLAVEYAEALRNGAKFPPPVAYRDGGVALLADGFHRVRAHELAGRTEIAIELREGDRRAAILYAAGANATHGARRTNQDKRRSVAALLADPEWREWSDREIAARCAVNHEMVGMLRKQLADSASSAPRRGKDGKVRRAPKRKAKPMASADRALKVARRGLDAVARRWKGEDRAPFVTMAREWLDGLAPAAQASARNGGGNG